MPEVVAYVALGSNLGDRQRHLREAVAALDAMPEVAVVRVSPVYESEAHTLTPGEVAPPFLNAVACLRTSLGAERLLDVLLGIEREAGRDRSRAVRWAPRTLDLDLLLYDDLSMDSPRLTVPHPRLGERRFVLQPLADLAPNLRVPAPFDATVGELLARCTDPGVPARTTTRLRANEATDEDA